MASMPAFFGTSRTVTFWSAGTPVTLPVMRTALVLASRISNPPTSVPAVTSTGTAPDDSGTFG